MFGLGGAELALIGVVAVLFLGPKKIPEFAKGLGTGIKTFKNSLNENENNPIEKS